MASVNTMAERPSAKAAKSKRGLVIGAASAVAVAVIGGVVLLNGKSGGDVAPAHAVAPVATAPAVTPPPAPAPKPAPRETPPPAPTQVLVRINSEPSGALVTDAKRGVVIGATPFEQRLERKKESTLGVRLAKDGFAPMDLEIPLGGDFEKAVRLEHLKAHASSKSASKQAPSSGKKPVVTAPAAATAPAAPATAPPPVAAQPPPAAKPKSAEKW